MSKSGYKVLSVKEYEQIKALLDAGVAVSVLQKITGRSSATLYYIKNTADLKGYREATREANSKAKAIYNARHNIQKPVAVTTTEETPAATDQTTKVLEKMEEMYELLEIVNDKLDRVAVPTRRFGR